MSWVNAILTNVCCIQCGIRLNPQIERTTLYKPVCFIGNPATVNNMHLVSPDVSDDALDLYLILSGL
jgi:hypothetical protein